MPGRPTDLRRPLADLRARLGARAAGAWRVEPGRLVQVAFDAAPDLPARVAEGFAAATAAVPLDRREFSIVAAALDGRRAAFVAAEIPPDLGSGLWLRDFGADRSVAVPVAGPDGAVVGVVSVALAGDGSRDELVEAAIRDEAASWTF